MRQASRILSILCVGAAAAAAQQGRLSGPVTGYVFDGPSKAFRAVLGMPGASILGDRIPLGYETRSVTVSPVLDSAIAIGTDGAVHFLRIDDGAVSERAASGLDPAQAAVFSPGGSAAALFSNQTLQVVTGLPDSPKLRSTISLGAQPGRSVAGVTSSRPQLRRLSLAVSDDGEYALFAGAASVRLLGSGGEDRNLAEAASGSLVAFAPGGHDAAVADPQSGLLLFRNAAGAPVRRVLAPKETVAAASGLEFTADGAGLLLTNDERGVLSFDVASGDRKTVPCECVPSGLHRMGRVFRLNEAGAGPLWLLDAAAAEPRTVFVPALSGN